MKSVSDYESLAYLDPHRIVCEAYSGTSIVQWFGKIERQLSRAVEEHEMSRNFVYADKLRKFLQIWRDNPLTGSINIEDIKVLKAASEVLAVDAWSMRDYFSNLRDQLRTLQASNEELPRVDMDRNDAMKGPGGGGGGGGMPPLSPDFGGEEEPPGDAAAPAGGNVPEGPGEAPESPEAPGAEGAPGAPGAPEAATPEDQTGPEELGKPKGPKGPVGPGK